MDKNNQNIKISLINDKDSEFNEEPYRWVILVLFSLLNLANGFSWLTFTTLSSEFNTVYNLSDFAKNYFAYSIMFTTAVFLYPAFYVTEYKSIRFGVNLKLKRLILGRLYY